MNEQKALELEMRRGVIITEALRMASLKFIPEDLKFEEISDNFNNVYLDFNVFQAIENQNIVLRDDLAFIYSPIHINEVVRMKNDTYECKRIQTISSVCNNRICFSKLDRMIIANIEPAKLIQRARENRALIKKAEECENIGRDDLEVYFEEYTTDIHKKRINSLKENPLNLLKQDNTYCDGHVFKLKYYGDLLEFNLEDLSEIRSFSKRYDLIKGLFKILDLLSFQREANERTRMSSYHDVDHALYASWAKFFITNDSRLAEKTKYIYDFLGIATKVFELKDFNLTLVST